MVAAPLAGELNLLPGKVIRPLGRVCHCEQYRGEAPPRRHGPPRKAPLGVAAAKLEQIIECLHGAVEGSVETSPRHQQWIHEHLSRQRPNCAKPAKDRLGLPQPPRLDQ
jgi:hypothetical protein